MERKTLEADLTNQQLSNLQQELLLRTSELQKAVDLAKEKERSLEMVTSTLLHGAVT